MADASGGLPQLALREMRAHLTDRRTLAAILGVGSILGIIGPFETSGALRLVPRLAYWLAIAAATYASGYLIGALIFRARPAWPLALKIGLSGALNGLAVTAIVSGLNVASFGHVPDRIALLELLATASAVSAIIFALSHVLTPHEEQADARDPAILDRLPIEKRGALLALSVEDHYVRVLTDKGEELLLMRLSDAIRETGNVAGAQVHRSHWVAWAAVAQAARKGDRAILTLTSGAQIPVSRSNLGKLRTAGILR